MSKKAAAVVTILRAADMTPSGRKRIADWLRAQARFLTKSGPKFSARFTARYLYRETPQ